MVFLLKSPLIFHKITFYAEKKYMFNPKNCYICQKSFLLFGISAIVLLVAVVEIKSQSELTMALFNWDKRFMALNYIHMLGELGCMYAYIYVGVYEWVYIKVCVCVYGCMALLLRALWYYFVIVWKPSFTWSFCYKNPLTQLRISPSFRIQIWGKSVQTKKHPIREITTIYINIYL